MKLGRRQHHFGKSYYVPADTPRPAPGYEVYLGAGAEPEAQFDVPDEVAVEAASHGAPATEWWAARCAGADVAQAVALSACGSRALLAGAIAAPVGLATFDEIASAAKISDPYIYLVTRETGLSHEEAVVAMRTGAAVLEALLAKFDKADVVEALASGIAPADYATLRRVSSHHDAISAHTMGIRPADYALARQTGASHQEVVEAVQSGTNLWDFTRRRNLGLDDLGAAV